MMTRKFSCVQGCSDCCVYREYCPAVEYGKIGVLLLPEEKAAIEAIASATGVNVKIIPRLAVGKQSPERVIAYQMMGKNEDGDLCPFLDVEGAEKSAHGGHKCKIYSDRPLACRAYPLVDSRDNGNLDGHCQFCKKFSTTSASIAGLQQEVEALSKIKEQVRAEDSQNVWRYATATARAEDRGKLLPEGWVRES